MCAFSMITKIFTHILLLYPHGEKKKKKSTTGKSLEKQSKRKQTRGRDHNSNLLQRLPNAY